MSLVECGVARVAGCGQPSDQDSVNKPYIPLGVGGRNMDASEFPVTSGVWGWRASFTPQSTLILVRTPRAEMGSGRLGPAPVPLDPIPFSVFSEGSLCTQAWAEGEKWKSRKFPFAKHLCGPGAPEAFIGNRALGPHDYPATRVPLAPFTEGKTEI